MLILTVNLISAHRADVTVYVGSDNTIENQLQVDNQINFTTPKWSKVASLENKLIQTIWINPREKARFVAVTRSGLINLAEVEVFQQQPGEYVTGSIMKTPRYKIAPVKSLGITITKTYVDLILILGRDYHCILLSKKLYYNLINQ